MRAETGQIGRQAVAHRRLHARRPAAHGHQRPAQGRLAGAVWNHCRAARPQLHCAGARGAQLAVALEHDEDREARRKFHVAAAWANALGAKEGVGILGEELFDEVRRRARSPAVAAQPR